MQWVEKSDRESTRTCCMKCSSGFSRSYRFEVGEGISRQKTEIYDCSLRRTYFCPVRKLARKSSCSTWSQGKALLANLRLAQLRACSLSPPASAKAVRFASLVRKAKPCSPTRVYDPRFQRPTRGRKSKI